MFSEFCESFYEVTQPQGGPGNPKLAIGVSSEGGHVWMAPLSEQWAHSCISLPQ